MIKGKTKRNWETDCKAFIEKLPKVQLSESEVKPIKNFCKEIMAAKLEERHYQVDNDQIDSRFETGFFGQAAVDKFLGINTFDYSVGKSKEYDVSDLSSIDIDCGVKSADWSNYHVIHKRAKRSEILTVRYNEYEYIICGLATIDILQSYQDDKLIMSHKLRARGVKTGFYGYEHLKQFKNLEELKTLL